MSILVLNEWLRKKSKNFVCLCDCCGGFYSWINFIAFDRNCVWEISSHWMTACKNAWIEECKKKELTCEFLCDCQVALLPTKIICLSFVRNFYFCGSKQYLNYVINDWEKCCRKQHINCRLRQAWVKFLHVYPPLVTHLKQRHADTMENFTAC